MIKCLLKAVVTGLATTVVADYRRLSLQLIRIEAAKSYVRGVQVIRSSVGGLMMLGLVIGLICVGLLLFHAGLFMLLPWGVKAKALLGVLLGAGYMTLGGLALRAAMKERTWMEKSGAVKMLEEATRPAQER
jgi:hypothetical protein